MRSSHVATTLVALTAGLTAASALHRRADRRGRATASVPAAVPAAPVASLVTTPVAPAVAAPVGDGVVLQFVRPISAVAASEQPATPARCGDTGGQTKAGAPCAARATTAGRCHHHRIAA